jgi:ureidoacrylate peracid hydrolase
LAKISRLSPELSASNVGLVLFDVLNGYLHTKDEAKQAFLAEQAIVENQQRLLTAARAVGITTFYPIGLHADDGSDTVSRLTDTDMELRPRGEATIKPKFFKGSWEAQIIDELAPLSTDVVVPKNRWSSFFSTNFDLQLRVRGIDTIVIAGGPMSASPARSSRPATWITASLSSAMAVSRCVATTTSSSWSASSPAWAG